MERFFNVAGMCRPEEHYMIEPEGRLARLRPLIDRKAWFVVHAPRQSGKTTTTRLLAEALTASAWTKASSSPSITISAATRRPLPNAAPAASRCTADFGSPS